jgi:hypothetical protein
MATVAIKEEEIYIDTIKCRERTIYDLQEEIKIFQTAHECDNVEIKRLSDQNLLHITQLDVQREKLKTKVDAARQSFLEAFDNLLVEGAFEEA